MLTVYMKINLSIINLHTLTGACKYLYVHNKELNERDICEQTSVCEYAFK